MINSQNLIDKICARIACGGMSDLQTCQTTNSLSILSNPVVSVANRSSLPNAAAYEGRMIYVDDENRYYHAIDGLWTNNFTSEVVVYKSEMYTWGFNGTGRLGDGTTTDRSSPGSVVGFTDWCQVAAGTIHTAAVRTNGTLWAWGVNASGQLGDNTTTNRSSPVSVIGGFTDWCQVAGGFLGAHTAAVRTNGTLWAWGSNNRGQLGDNTLTNRSSPVSVVGGFTDWCQVSASYCHTAAVRTNGTLWAWGLNYSGRLGDGTTISKTSPVSVVGGFTDWCQVSAGFTHTAAIRTNGTLWAWGCGNLGQLGEGIVTVGRSSPVSVIGGFTDWCQVAAGQTHTAAVRTNGTLWAWGANTYGWLGDNTSTNKSSPVSVVGGFTDWCQVAANYRHTAAVRTNGTLWAWGRNNCGQLGDGTTTTRSSPVLVSGGFTNWCQVAAGRCHTAAVRFNQKGF